MTRNCFHALILVLLLSAAPAFADRNTVLLFPFSVYSETSMDFLKKGTGDLVETRLAGRGLRVIRSDSEMDKNDAMKQAINQSADTFVVGSLTFLGNTISVNALLVGTKTGDTLVSYVKADSDKDRLFSHVTEFADQAAGRLVKAPEAPVPVAESAVKTAPPEPAAPPVAAAPVVPAPAVTPLAFPAAPASLVLTSEPRRSEDLPGEITSLCAGDVNGDSVMELVYAERHSFTVASFSGKTLNILQKVECKNFLDILFVDAFDANKNGLHEIFVTALHVKTGRVSSTVYEWNGKSYAMVREDLPYFFRAGKSPETGQPMLLGQEQHMARDIFGESIFEMIWSAGRQNYIPLKTLKTPAKDLNIFGMDTGDLKNNGVVTSVVYLPNDHLAVVDFLKQSSWKSPEPWGGSSKYIEPKNQDTRVRVYIPPRLVAGDFDKNKSQEFVTLVNTNSTPKIFNNLRKYVQGRVECLAWKSLRFETLWKTQDVSGYIPDFAIGDADGDGTDDVIYPVVNKGGFFSNKDISYIVVQPIAF